MCARIRNPGGLELRSLRYVVTIAEHGSFARAAAALGVTQPALSRSVQALERSLGVSLFDRGRTGVAATAFGALLVRRGRALLDESGAIEREIALLAGLELGELRVGAGAYPAEICVGPAAARLLSERPRLNVRVVVGDWPELVERVLAGDLDLAVCELTEAAEDPRLVTEALPQHPGVLFCRAGHPLAAQATIDLPALAAYPIALTTLPDRLAPLVRSRTPRDDRRAAPEIHVDTFELARRIVLGSDAIGAAVEEQLADDLAAGRATVLPIAPPWLITRYGMIRLAGRTLSPSAQGFMEQVRTIEHGIGASAVGAGRGRVRSAHPRAREPRR